MKKIIKSLLLVVLLLIPYIVKADMGLPPMKEYEVEVVKDEIYYYDYSGNPKGTIKKGTKLTITYGWVDNGEEYLYGEYNNNWVYIKSKDVVTKEEFGIDAEGVAQYTPRKIKVTKELEVKKGPSESFETVGTIKKGEYEFEYVTQTPIYIYIDTKDVKGWINSEEEGTEFGGITYIIPVEKETKCGTIPANYEFKNVWYDDIYPQSVTVKYKDCDVELKILTDIAEVDLHKKVYKSKKEIEIYKNIGSNPEKAEKTIPEGKEFVLITEQFVKNQFTQNAEFYYYVEYNKKQYWITADDLINNSEFVKDYVEPEEKEEDEEKEESSSMDSKTIIIICVVAGVSLALGALVTLLLVNKKGKKETKVEKTAKEEKKETKDEEKE